MNLLILQNDVFPRGQCQLFLSMVAICLCPSQYILTSICDYLVNAFVPSRTLWASSPNKCKLREDRELLGLVNLVLMFFVLHQEMKKRNRSLLEPDSSPGAQGLCLYSDATPALSLGVNTGQASGYARTNVDSGVRKAMLKPHFPTRKGLRQLTYLSCNCFNL